MVGKQIVVDTIQPILGSSTRRECRNRKYLTMTILVNGRPPDISMSIT